MIIEQYIKQLVYGKQYELAAMYCSVLPTDDQLITYGLIIQSTSPPP